MRNKDVIICIMWDLYVSQGLKSTIKLELDDGLH